MDSNAAWGAIFVAYVVPWFFWMLSRDQTLEVRKKLNPVRKVEEDFDASTTRYGMVWLLGMGLLLFAWWSGWRPIEALVVLGLAGLLVVAYLLVRHRKRVFSSALFRFWTAASATWVLSVTSWYLIFQESTSLENYQFLMIGAFPSLVAGLAIIGYRWAKAGER